MHDANVSILGMMTFQSLLAFLQQLIYSVLTLQLIVSLDAIHQGNKLFLLSHHVLMLLPLLINEAFVFTLDRFQLVNKNLAFLILSQKFVVNLWCSSSLILFFKHLLIFFILVSVLSLAL